MEQKLVEIRWHGRGGQGAVTSAEMIALAAFEEGKYAQAFPSFGPERRGAPVLAFDRISLDEPIRSRAAVENPDVVVVFEHSLLSIVDVTSGLKDDGIIVLNTSKSIEEVQKLIGKKWRIATVNASAIAKEIIKVDIVNTTMLGALAKATGVVKLESMVKPLEERFGARGKSNFNSAVKAFEQTVIHSSVDKSEKRTAHITEKLPTWKEITVGCAVLKPGSAGEYKTGDWKTQHPVWNRDKCIKCGMCYMFCPEFCITEDTNGYFDANLYYCKGCGICARECWPQAISMVQES